MSPQQMPTLPEHLLSEPMSIDMSRMFEARGLFYKMTYDPDTT